MGKPWRLAQHEDCIKDKKELQELVASVETSLRNMSAEDRSYLVGRLDEFKTLLETVQAQVAAVIADNCETMKAIESLRARQDSLDDEIGQAEQRLLVRIEELEEGELSEDASSHTEKDVASQGFVPFSQRKAARQAQLSNPSALAERILGKTEAKKE